MPTAGSTVWAGSVRSNIISLSSMQDTILSNEGVHILPVKPNHGPHQNFLCSPQGRCPVKTKHTFISRLEGLAGRAARVMLMALLALTAVSALSQTSETIDSVRVIGNRRIPKETILARLFIHPGDTYEVNSVEASFQSLWNTGYFENLRVEREDSEKGVILNIFVTEKPNIREIKYNGLSSISQSDILYGSFW